jgi:hypothetical protein
LPVAPGPTQPTVPDPRAGSQCTVAVLVTRNHAPVEGIVVRASIRQGPDPRQRKAELLGVTDAAGVATGTVPGDAHFDLIASTSDERQLGNTTTTFNASPGRRLETTIEIATGTLVVELPASVTRPEQGRIGVSLRGPVYTWLFAYADTPGMRGTPTGGPRIPWESNVLAFGEFASAEYELTVTFQRFESDSKGGMKRGSLRAPYKTMVKIETGREARVVVP